MYRYILVLIMAGSLFACANAGMTDLKLQAESGDSNAQYLIGYSYERGKNNNRDLNEAAKWYQKAAENNNPRAQRRLGLLYATGNGVKQDFSKTAELFKSAANLGYGAAQMDYAMFLYGMAPPEYKDEIAAYAWFVVIERNDPKTFASIEGLKLELESKLNEEQLKKARQLGAEYVSKFGA